MSTGMIVGLLLVLLAAGAFVMLRGGGRRSTRSASGARIVRVRDPRQTTLQAGHVWVMQAGNPRCAPAAAANGKRYAGGDAIPLPLPGCGQGNCQCHYRAVPERRQKERRSGSSRRDSFRLDAGPDRRQQDRRHSVGVWSHRD